jgi:hypothetical protein
MACRNKKSIPPVRKSNKRTKIPLLKCWNRLSPSAQLALVFYKDPLTVNLCQVSGLYLLFTSALKVLFFGLGYLVDIMYNN